MKNIYQVRIQVVMLRKHIPAAYLNFVLIKRSAMEQRPGKEAIIKGQSCRKERNPFLITGGFCTGGKKKMVPGRYRQVLLPVKMHNG